MTSSTSSRSSSTSLPIDLFKEPEDYLPPTPPSSTTSYILANGQSVSLRLVGHNPLWGHLLWNGGRVVSDYLQEHASELVFGRDVLELGAGAGLPGIVCGILGATRVVITDYPDQDLIENINLNIENCSQFCTSTSSVTSTGYIWGQPLPSIIHGRFHTLILADLLFNHSQHHALLHSIQLALAKEATACALVFFTAYRPWLLTKDLAFFDLARAASMKCEKVIERDMGAVMFEEDPGDERVRRMCWGWKISWANQEQLK